MLGAVVFGHEQMQVAIRAIKELAAQAGKPRWSWQAPVENPELTSAVTLHAQAALAQAYSITEKQQRHVRLSEIKAKTLATLAGGSSPSGARRLSRACSSSSRATSCASASSTVSRASTARHAHRAPDHGQRSGAAACPWLGAVHPRGNQALVATTLGTTRDAQIIDALEGERREPFMLHYNFPPFSVGETGMMVSPNAARSVTAICPPRRARGDAGHTVFPYVIRVVSEILESNGSSSMASVCGTSLSLMDAGVPIKGRRP